jgi:hypothetical protein
MAVVRLVFAVNVALAVLAALSIGAASMVVDLATLVVGGGIVAALLVVMWRGRR